MSTPQHHSLVQVDFSDESGINRRSDINTTGALADKTQPRHSDYQFSPDWEAGSSSNAVIYANDDARMTAYSDRLVYRPRGSVRSNNRISSVYGANLTSWASNHLGDGVTRFTVPRDFEAQSVAAHQQWINEKPSNQPSPAVKDEYCFLIDAGPSYKLPKSDRLEFSPRQAGRRFRAHPSSAAASPIPLFHDLDVAFGDTCDQVLFNAFKEYDIAPHTWSQYHICIDYSRTIRNAPHYERRRLARDEQPLVVMKTLKGIGSDPRMMLRKFSAPQNEDLSLDQPDLENSSRWRQFGPPTAAEQCRNSRSESPSPLKSAVSLVGHARTYDGLRLGFHFLSYHANEMFEVVKYRFGGKEEIDGDDEDFWLVISTGTVERTWWISRTHLLLVQSVDSYLPDHPEPQDYVSTKIARIEGYRISHNRVSLLLNEVRTAKDRELREAIQSLQVPTVVLSGSLRIPSIDHNGKCRIVHFQAIIRRHRYGKDTIGIWPKYLKDCLLEFFSLPESFRKIIARIGKSEGPSVTDQWQTFGSHLLYWSEKMIAR